MVGMSDRRQAGISYIEMIATVAVLMIIASAIAPMARATNQRRKEIELRRALREIRQGIDVYRQFSEEAVQTPPFMGLPPGAKIPPRHPPYPEKLEDLVEGVGMLGVASASMKLKVLRHLPRDPMTNSKEWGMRCYEDEPDSTSWCGSNVWDVYTKSNATALDGTRYRDW
jgi:general secretion pathway protein G